MSLQNLAPPHSIKFICIALCFACSVHTCRLVTVRLVNVTLRSCGGATLLLEQLLALLLLPQGVTVWFCCLVGAWIDSSGRSGCFYVLFRRVSTNFLELIISHVRCLCHCTVARRESKLLLRVTLCNHFLLNLFFNHQRTLTHVDLAGACLSAALIDGRVARFRKTLGCLHKLWLLGAEGEPLLLVGVGLTTHGHWLLLSERACGLAVGWKSAAAHLLPLGLGGYAFVGGCGRDG